MAIPTIFDLCRPRDDVVEGRAADADFAADLAQVLTGEAAPGYRDPALFFQNTHPTRGLRNLVENVCRRLSGAGGSANAIFRLDTSYGGGKTHGLIALAHAARGMEGVAHPEEFVDPALLPAAGSVRIAAFDGENADPANGRDLGGGIRARTPWGEIAHALAGADGYETVRESDEQRTAPGAGTLRDLFGDGPALILLDELAVYLRKVGGPKSRAQGGQLTAFLTSLFKAVENAPNAALVYTLAIGKDGKGADAYAPENEFVARQMEELDSVSARKATLLNPTEEDETALVLRRRLFESVDEEQVGAVVEAYRSLWRQHEHALPANATRSETTDRFRASYPFHPEVLDTLTGKTATIADFQRVRGMLRLLAHTVAHLWQERPADAHAIHLHHIDPGQRPIHQEIVTRLNQKHFLPAITNDVASGSAGSRSRAEQIDAEHFAGQPPYTAYTARTIFFHTLAFNEALQGLTASELRYALIGPGLDSSFLDEARKKFLAESAYLDDRPLAKLRFRAEANLNRELRVAEEQVDLAEARARLREEIRGVFREQRFELVPFARFPSEIPDDADKKGLPRLVVLDHEEVTVERQGEKIPDLVVRLFEKKGTEGVATRELRNHLVFLVADGPDARHMKERTRSRIALERLKAAHRISDFAEHQQREIREREKQSVQGLAVAIQQCYRHLFYPSRVGTPDPGIHLRQSVLDRPAPANKPGAGQSAIVNLLQRTRKLRLPEDPPDGPAFVRDRTPLRNGPMTTRDFRQEFRRNPGLPILIGDTTFLNGIRQGIAEGEYIYEQGQLLSGPGDPEAAISLQGESRVMTVRWARAEGIWPRPKPEGRKDKKKDERKDEPKPADQRHFRASGSLEAALRQVWEQVRHHKVPAVRSVTIDVVDSATGFGLLAATNGVPDATKTVNLKAGCESADGGTLQVEFRGPLPAAGPVKEFLEAQLRAVPVARLKAQVTLSFAEGLPMAGNAAEKLSKHLTRVVRGDAQVTATADNPQGDQK